MGVSGRVVLITGANRGLGHGFTKAFLSQSNCVVLACVRNPDHPTSRALKELPTGSRSSVHVLKLDVAETTDYPTLEQELSQIGVEHLDVVIANAGIATAFPTALEADPKDIRAHIDVNVIGPLLLFQTLQPMLSQSLGKLVTISSGAGSSGAMERFLMPNAAYGPSKATLNYLIRKIHFENEDIVAFALDPGWVQTDMGNKGARDAGLEKAVHTVECSVAGMVKVIDNATRAETSGRFKHFSGTDTPW